MACLFCGKDIGPIRLIRDSEFCSPKHRKQYKDRLQKVLVRVGAPETVPNQIAPFQDTVRPHPGRIEKSEAAFDFSITRRRTRLPQSWTLEIPDAGGSVFARLELTACELAPAKRALTDRADADSPAAPSSAPMALAHRVADPAFPLFELSAAACDELTAGADPAPLEVWMTTLAPEPAVAAGLPSASLPIAARNGVHVPSVLPEPPNQPMPILDEFVTPPQPSESWMRSPAPEPAARIVQTAVAGPLPLAAELRLPVALSAAPAAPKPEIYGTHLAGPAPDAAQMEARLSVPAIVPFPAALVAPGLRQFAVVNPGLGMGDPRCMSIPGSEPAVREVRPAALNAPLAFAAAPVRLAPLVIQPVNDLLEILVEKTPAAKAPVREVQFAPRAAAPKPPSRKTVDSAPALVARPSGKSAAPSPVVLPAAGQLQTEVPQAGLFALDFHCPAGPVTPRPVLHWTSRVNALSMPRFGVRPLFDRVEDQSALKPERKKAAFAEIFTMPDAVALTRRKAARHAFTAIAASVTVAMALWFGANAGKFGKDLLNREAAEEIANAAHIQSGAGLVETASAPARPEPKPFQHPVAWVRTEAAKRATVQVADSFENGMAAWGAKGKGWAAGWSHSADGYVRPGQLALFQPTLNFADYRMDFFGEIESRSMSWVVRGKDTRNYYAMKFNILEPGLRPVLSMTHYPVVGGKQGHKVDVPLSVMVHNNMPYHVSVEVKGSHYTASIEGQEVDSWSDDTLLAGGVGFFSDAGARARIYWMKVSKNDDWFGRLCGRIAGDAETRDTAWLDRPALPVPQPDKPAPAPATAALWPAEAAETWYGRLQREKGSWKGEIETWSS